MRSLLVRTPAAGLPARPPEGQRDLEQVLDRAYEEYCRLLEAGEAVDPDEFCRRYPGHEAFLRSVLTLHATLDQNLPVEDEDEDGWPAAGGAFLHFQIMTLIGKGAFSRVYLAAEPDLGNRLVALKVSPLTAHEARTMGPLHHPHVVDVHSVHRDESTGLAAVCMPYLGSATLCDVRDQAFAGPGPPEGLDVIHRAAADRFLLAPLDAAGGGLPRQGSYAAGIAHLGVRLAEGLAFVHARGVYHRDLKPSNVLLTPQGRPMLLDFNLSDNPRLGRGAIGGTLRYMAPEQRRAVAHESHDEWAALGARSDVYALGVVLYELLAGRHPFGLAAGLSGEETGRLLEERQPAGPAPLRQFNPRVDPELARVVERCLAYAPADRFAGAAELAAALRPFVPRPRRRTAWLVTAAAAAGLLAGLGAYGVLAHEPDRDAAPAGLAEPDSARALAEGTRAYRAQRFRDAALWFDRALAADPKLARAHFARGRAYQQLGDRARSRGQQVSHLLTAVASYQEADQLAPSGRTRACIGYCAARAANHSLAIAADTDALAAGFARAELLNNLAYSYLQYQRADPRLEKARAALDAALAKNPKLQAALYNRAFAELRRVMAPPGGGDPRRGIRDVESAIRIGPAGPNLYRLAAYLYAQQAAKTGDQASVKRALQYVEKAITSGMRRARLEHDAALKILRQAAQRREFERVLRTPGPATSAPDGPRLVDPVDGLGL